MKYLIILCIICLLSNSYAQLVVLSPTELNSYDNNITIWVENPVYITNLIFFISGVTIDDYFGSMVANSMVSINPELGMVIISPLSYIPPQNGVLIYLTITDVQDDGICIDGAYGNMLGGEELNIQIGNCLEYNFSDYFILGDLNIDGDLDVLDITILVNIILNNATMDFFNQWCPDLNFDNIINVLDIVLLVNIIIIE